jgi:hypothetical protein
MPEEVKKQIEESRPPKFSHASCVSLARRKLSFIPFSGNCDRVSFDAFFDARSRAGVASSAME